MEFVDSRTSGLPVHRHSVLDSVGSEGLAEKWGGDRGTQLLRNRLEGSVRLTLLPTFLYTDRDFEEVRT